MKGGFVGCTWTLKEGHTVPAGQWVFAGQYGPRHGTVLPVTGAEYERLLDRTDSAQPTKYVGFGSLYVRFA